MLSETTLCSRALVIAGGEAISSFDEGTLSADTANDLYPGVRDLVLSMHPWHFCTKTITLTEDAATPAANWKYQYSIPGDWLAFDLVSLPGSEVPIDHDIEERKLLGNFTPIAAKYRFRAKPLNWPAWFDQLAIEFLAAAFCEPITESNTKALNILERVEKITLPRCRLINSRNSSPGKFRDETLLHAHRGG